MSDSTYQKADPVEPDELDEVLSYAQGEPVDHVAAERYAETLPDLREVLRLARSPKPNRSQTGRLRCAAIAAALDS